MANDISRHYSQNAIALMKAQLSDIERNPKRYEALLSSGYVVAGFGGELNGVDVPETFLQGRLPAGMSAKDALAQVIAIMKQTIAKAESEQKKLR